MLDNAQFAPKHQFLRLVREKLQETRKLKEKKGEHLELSTKNSRTIVGQHTSLPFIVEADASESAAGAILSQKDLVSAHLHPVAYMSKKFLAAERNYTVAERELLDIRLAFKEWHHYLLGDRKSVV